MIEQSIRERITENGADSTLRAAVYARTSTKKQEYGHSLDAQVSRCVDRARSLGWKVQFIYRDEAESGKDTDRPMFQEMLAAAETRGIDVILFWKLDRFSRSLMHAVRLESELRNHDVALYSVTEQIDTTSATGRFNFRNLASAAEFEREMIKERTNLSLNEMAADRRWPNQTPPLGYDITPEGRLTISSEEKDLVVRIFEMYTDLQSMPEVASRLNEEGIETQEQGEWTPRAVGDILRNEIYRGQYELGDVSEHVPEYRIISDQMFEQVTTIRMRFQSDNTSRKSMPESRKERMTQAMQQMYLDYLDSCS